MMVGETGNVRILKEVFFGQNSTLKKAVGRIIITIKEFLTHKDIWWSIHALKKLNVKLIFPIDKHLKNLSQQDLQCFAIENHQDPVYAVNWHFQDFLTDVKSAAMLFFKLSGNRQSLGLSNELL